LRRPSGGSVEEVLGQFVESLPRLFAAARISIAGKVDDGQPNGTARTGCHSDAINIKKSGRPGRPAGSGKPRLRQRVDEARFSDVGTTYQSDDRKTRRLDAPTDGDAGDELRGENLQCVT
jgi:hypothetical protein